jgi:hypothetical protein
VYGVGFVDSGVITSVVQFLISKGTFGFGSELFLGFWFCLLWCVFDRTFDLVLRQVCWILKLVGFVVVAKNLEMVPPQGTVWRFYPHYTKLNQK